MRFKTTSGTEYRVARNNDQTLTVEREGGSHPEINSFMAKNVQIAFRMPHIKPWPLGKTDIDATEIFAIFTGVPNYKSIATSNIGELIEFDPEQRVVSNPLMEL